MATKILLLLPVLFSRYFFASSLVTDKLSIWDVTVYKVELYMFSRMHRRTNQPKYIGEYKLYNDTFNARHKSLLKTKLSNTQIRHFKHVEDDYYLHLSYQKDQDYYQWKIISAVSTSLEFTFKSLVNAVNKIPEAELIFSQSLHTPSIPAPSRTLDQKAFIKISFNTDIDYDLMNTLIKVQNDLVIYSSFIKVIQANGINFTCVSEFDIELKRLLMSRALKKNDFNIIWIGVACTLILLHVLCLLCILKCRKETKELTKLRHISQSVNRMNVGSVPMVENEIRRISALKQNDILELSKNKSVSQSVKWEPEKFDKMIENSNAVQDVIISDIVEDMHKEGIVIKETDQVDETLVEGDHRTGSYGKNF